MSEHLDAMFDSPGDPDYQEALAGVSSPQHRTILDDAVSDWLEKTREGVPRIIQRAEGIHASEILDMCCRYEVFKREIPIEADGQKFNGDTLKLFAVGSAVHEWWQGEILGKMRVLKGTWECSRCTYQVKGFMPTDPCSNCNWQVDRVSHYPKYWTKDPIDCASGCRWPGGFEREGRDCAHCERGGKWLFRETRIYVDEYDVVGSLDGVILYANQWRVLELKSKNPFQFPKMTFPDPKHVFQTQVYMWATGVHFGVVIYVDKNSGAMKEFPVDADPDVEALIERRVRTIKGSRERKILPNGVCSGPRDKRAKGCAFKRVCFLGTDDLEEVRREAPKKLKVIA